MWKVAINLNQLKYSQKLIFKFTITKKKKLAQEW